MSYDYQNFLTILAQFLQNCIWKQLQFLSYLNNTEKNETFSLFETSVNGSVTFAYIMVFHCTSVLQNKASQPVTQICNFVGLMNSKMHQQYLCLQSVVGVSLETSPLMIWKRKCGFKLILLLKYTENWKHGCVIWCDHYILRFRIMNK